MKNIAFIILFLFITSLAVADVKLLSASSPAHRVTLLELYTSEGCSSCPPADKFLSRLKKSGFTNNQLIPLAFHVTYWDYIGWKDPYASTLHDQRQRSIAKINNSKSIYTPQFVFNGTDYRDYNAFSENIRKVALQPANIDIALDADLNDKLLIVNIKTDSSPNHTNTIMYYLALYENKLVSHVQTGENEGVTLNHDYVVRNIYGPFKQDDSTTTGLFQQVIKLDAQWKQHDLGVVVFAQNPITGEVLQAVDLKFF